jgi:predicted AAA+ superfamily ATPase
MVYFELLRRGYKVFVGEVNNVEVDFVALKDWNIKHYQVSQSIINKETLDRELKPFVFYIMIINLL